MEIARGGKGRQQFLELELSKKHIFNHFLTHGNYKKGQIKRGHIKKEATKKRGKWKRANEEKKTPDIISSFIFSRMAFLKFHPWSQAVIIHEPCTKIIFISININVISRIGIHIKYWPSCVTRESTYWHGLERKGQKLFFPNKAAWRCKSKRRGVFKARTSQRVGIKALKARSRWCSPGEGKKRKEARPPVRRGASSFLWFIIACLRCS